MPIPRQPRRHDKRPGSGGGPPPALAIQPSPITATAAPVAPEVGAYGAFSNMRVASGSLGQTSFAVEWDVAPACTGRVRYGTDPALSSGALLTDLQASPLSHHQQAVPSGGQPALSPNTDYYWRVVESVTALGLSRDSAIQGPVRTTSPAVTTPYGPAAHFDDKSNVLTNQGSYECASRFVATQTGQASKVRFRYRNSSGYGGGNFGFYRVGVQTDAAGLPSGTWVGSVYATWQPASTGTADQGASVTFPAGINLVAGTRYHLVWKNVAASPASNSSSINNPWLWSGSRQTPYAPAWPTDDWRVMNHYSAAWAVETGALPSFDLEYADGSHDGFGGIAGSQGGTDIYAAVTSTTPARQRFTPSRSVEVRRIGTRALRSSGGGSADLVATIKRISDGATMCSASLSGFPTAASAPNSISVSGGHWKEAAASQAATLVAGTEYAIEWSVPAGTTYWLRVNLWHYDSSNQGATDTHLRDFEAGLAAPERWASGAWGNFGFWGPHLRYGWYLTPSSTPAGTVYDMPTAATLVSLYGNVSAGINAVIAAVPNGTADNPSIVLFPRTEVYELRDPASGSDWDATVKLYGRSYLYLYGCPPSECVGDVALVEARQKAKISQSFSTQGYTTSSVISFSQTASTNCKVMGFEIAGGMVPSGGEPHRGQGESACGVHAYNGTYGANTGIEVAYNHIHNFGGHGVYIHGDQNLPASWNVHHNVMRMLGTMGVAMSNGADVSVDDNRIEDVGINPIDFEDTVTGASYQRFDRISIRRNRIDRWGYDDYYQPEMAVTKRNQAYPLVDCWIEDNSFYGGWQSWVYPSVPAGRSQMSTAGVIAITAGTQQGVYIRRNNAYFNVEGLFIRLHNCTNGDISDNHAPPLTGANPNGGYTLSETPVTLSNCTGVTQSGNTMP